MTADRIKLIVTDLDGTLLDGSGKVPESAKTALKKAKSSGLSLMVATGRSYEEALPYASAAGADSGFVLLTGALIADAAGRTVSLSAISGADAEAVARITEEYSGVYAEIYTGDSLYVKGRELIDTLNVPVEYSEYIKSEGIPAEELSKTARRTGALKFFILTNDPDDLAEMRGRISGISGVTCVSSIKNGIEVVKKGVDKGAALGRMMDELGLRRCEVAVIGDSENDMGMFEKAGLRIAMGNAIKELRDMADYVARSHDCGGISDAVAFILSRAARA